MIWSYFSQTVVFYYLIRLINVAWPVYVLSVRKTHLSIKIFHTGSHFCYSPKLRLDFFVKKKNFTRSRTDKGRVLRGAAASECLSYIATINIPFTVLTTSWRLVYIPCWFTAFNVKLGAIAYWLHKNMGQLDGVCYFFSVVFVYSAPNLISLLLFEVIRVWTLIRVQIISDRLLVLL